jgi:hypothetical protein
MLARLIKFWVATAAVMSSTQTNTAKKQTLTLQHIDSVDALQSTTDARGFLHNVPVAEQCIPEISSITTSVETQIDFFAPALLANPKIDSEIYKKIKRCVMEGTEEQIRILSEIITTLVNYSPEHQAYIDLALADDHPLYIFFVPEAELTHADSNVYCYYNQLTNSLVLSSSLVPTKDIGIVGHELLHRARHGMHTRLSRLTTYYYPFFPARETEAKEYQFKLQLGDHRILNQLRALFAAEQVSKPSNYLNRLREVLLDNNGKPFKVEVYLVLSDEQKNILLLQPDKELWVEKNGLRLLYGRHFTIILDNLGADAPHRITALIADPIAATIHALNECIKYVENNYPQSEYLSERETHAVQFLSVNILRKFYPEYLQDMMDVINYALTIPNRTKYRNKPQSFSDMKAIEESVKSGRLENTALINEENAESAFYTGLNNRSANPRIAENIFKTLIEKGLYVAESLTELATLTLQKNEHDQALEYFKQAEATFQASANKVGFTFTDWRNYALVSVHAGDFHSAERIYGFLIETDFSEIRKKTYKEELEAIDRHRVSLDDRNSTNQSNNESPRP